VRGNIESSSLRIPRGRREIRAWINAAVVFHARSPPKTWCSRVGNCCQHCYNPGMPTRNVNLSEQQAKFIRKSVDQGRFRNSSEVVRAGLRLLEQQELQEKLKLK